MFIFVCLVVSTLLVYFNLISERAASIVVFASAIAGVFFSSFGSARANDEKILLNSMSIGVLFCLVLIIISVAINGGFAVHTRLLALMAGIIASSFLGALFGK